MTRPLLLVLLAALALPEAAGAQRLPTIRSRPSAPSSHPGVPQPPPGRPPPRPDDPRAHPPPTHHGRPGFPGGHRKGFAFPVFWLAPWWWSWPATTYATEMATGVADAGTSGYGVSASEAAARREAAAFAWQVDEPAMPVDGATTPPYPASVRPRQPGSVLAQFVVGADGIPDPSTLRILRTSDRRLSDALREWLPQVRYRPARRGGVWVAQMVEEQFDFR